MLGAFFGLSLYSDVMGLLAGAVGGALVALWSFGFVGRLTRLSFGSVVGGLVGLVLGVVAAFAVMAVIGESVPPASRAFAGIFIGLICAYVANAVGSGHGKRLLDRRGTVEGLESQPAGYHVPKILDTSVIIDGRIADICEAGFLDGPLVLPQFVLHELQQIADSSDSLKRNRGRRGLEILKKIQQSPDLDIQILDTDFPKVREVDSKLVLLAKETGGKVMTNDFNLNKVAELQGVSVLNINELANAVKPVVLPGEVMNVLVLKEGKELGQGVGYLDDGTMVVVDQAKDHIGDNVSVSVTSVLQTTAGRMIFTKLRNESGSDRNGA
ncbi:PIN/TRAM domain-containing protein [Nitrospinota bacterium]